MLSKITEDIKLEELAKNQMQFMASHAKNYPMGYSFYLLAFNIYVNPPMHIICAMIDNHEKFPLDAVVRILHGGSKEYPCINKKTTYYICKNNRCLPPENNLNRTLLSE